jgi:ABC-type nitrate/sulfonate/bicarbonate transport system permease component
VLGIWALVTGLEWVKPAFLPAPWAVVKALLHLSWQLDPDGVGSSPLLSATLWSVRRVVLAVFLMVLAGVPIGILMGASPRIDAALSPLVDPLRYAPITAFLPLFIMWFGIEERMKVAFLWFGGVVYLVPMVRDAVRSVPLDYVVQAEDLGLSGLETVRHVLVPLALPRIADAVVVDFGIAWTYIVVAEYVNAKEGLGNLIQVARRLSATDQVFALIAVILALALLTDGSLRWLKARIFPWEGAL